MRISVSKDLTKLRTEAEARIDRAAECERLRHITPGSAQALVYQAKAEEARRYRVAGQPADLADYPLLRAETGLTMPTAPELAELWITVNERWRVTAAAIEAKRLAAKAAVRAAGNPAAIDRATTVDWTIPS